MTVADARPPHPVDPAVADTRAGPSRTTKLYLTLGAVGFVAVALTLTALRQPPVPASIDPATGLAVPPRGRPLELSSHWFSIAFAASSLPTAIGLAVRDYLRTRSLIPLALVLSAPAMAFPGTVVDVLGGAYMVDGPYLPTLTVLGREMGTFIFAAWSGFGIFLYLVHAALTRGARTRVLWWLLLGGCAGNIISEECLLPRGAYTYYGNQPLVLVNLLPWWWVPCNIVGCFLAAALAHRYRSVLRGWRVVALIITTPVSLLVVYAAAGVPSFVAVNSTYSWFWVQLLGLATVGLAIATFAVIMHLVLRRDPTS